MTYCEGDTFEAYTLLRKCGQGACGTVFLAENRITRRRVALKMIPLGGRTCEREIRGLTAYQAVCRRTNLLQIYHVGTAEDVLFYTMDAADDRGQGENYIPDTLANRLASDGSLPPETVRQMASDLAEDLARLHRANLLHRDIKPENILWIAGRATLGDIGLIAPPGGTVPAGTPGFMPPEVLAGLRPAAPADDFYALARSVYCALTGLPPEKFPSLPAELDLKKCADLIALYNKWDSGAPAVPLTPSPAPARRSFLLKIAAAVLTAGILAALLFTAGRRPVPPGISAPVKTPRLDIRAYARAARELAAQNPPTPGFTALMPALEREARRQRDLRTAAENAAFARPVSPEDLRRAAADPRLAPHPEAYLRIRRSDEARAEFDRKFADDPVRLYFAAADRIACELDRIEALAATPGLDLADFSRDLEKLRGDFSLRREMERRLLREGVSR